MAEKHDEGTAASPPRLLAFYEEDDEGFLIYRSWGLATKGWCALIRPLGGQRVEFGWYPSIADAEEATGWCCDWDPRRVMSDSDVEALSTSPGRRWTTTERLGQGRRTGGSLPPTCRRLAPTMTLRTGMGRLMRSEDAVSTGPAPRTFSLVTRSAMAPSVAVVRRLGRSQVPGDGAP